MAFDVNQFRNAMIFDGARPNLFQIEFQAPPLVNYGDLRNFTLMANSTQLPPSIVGVARQSYFGREVKFPGNRTFPDWSINIVNDETFDLRNMFEQWLNIINNHVGNVRDSQAVFSSGYSIDARVTQFGKAGNAVKRYNFVGLFPTQVDPINLNWGANDQIEEFGVTFSYQYWESTLDPLGSVTADSSNASGAAAQ